MPNSPEIPKEAVAAAKHKWRLVAELPRFEASGRGVSDAYREQTDRENDRAIAEVLEAAAPIIRKQERERLELNALCEWLRMVAEGRIEPTKVLTEAEGWFLSLLSEEAPDAAN